MPISLDDFIEKYNGKFVEYHSYGTGALNQIDKHLANKYNISICHLKKDILVTKVG
jgi:hypothetical protein